MNKYIPAILIGFAVALVFGWFMTAAGADGVVAWLAPALFGLIAFYIAANLAGTKVGKAASAEDKNAALSLTPAPGRARLIVYREGFVGMAAGLNISLDGRPFAQLKSPRFAAREISPGSHSVGATFGGLAKAQNNEIVAGFEAAEGDTVVFRATLAMGALKNSVVLERVTADTDLVARLRGMQMVQAASEADGVVGHGPAR